jgi:peptidoglycan/LPS O-acetylase OafA/YrhL
VSFSVERRHWGVFVLLFLVNLIVLVIRIPSGTGIEVRAFAIMIVCSALVSFLIALLLVALFDKMLRSRNSKQKEVFRRSPAMPRKKSSKSETVEGAIPAGQSQQAFPPIDNALMRK